MNKKLEELKDQWNCGNINSLDLADRAYALGKEEGLGDGEDLGCSGVRSECKRCFHSKDPSCNCRCHQPQETPKPALVEEIEWVSKPIESSSPYSYETASFTVISETWEQTINRNLITVGKLLERLVNAHLKSE